MRVTSLCLAGMASVIGLVFPFALARQPTGLNQSLLLVLMAGIVGAFIYGAGFQPRARLARLAICPYATWLILVGSLTGLFWLR
jgi:predicted membrane protein